MYRREWEQDIPDRRSADTFVSKARHRERRTAQERGMEVAPSGECLLDVM